MTGTTVPFPSRLEIARRQADALRESERMFAEKTKNDLLQYPGYFPAARVRLAELRKQHGEKSHWMWAIQEWEQLLDQGLGAVLGICDGADEHQELLSASPFAVMRPPLPENNFYASYAGT